MMVILEGNLAFTFPGGWRASKYDDWSFYRNQSNSCCSGSKAVDILGCPPSAHAVDNVWLVEVKDYRANVRTKPSELSDEVAWKVRDTLAGLMVASMRANDLGEKRFARSCLKSSAIRVVLHLEQPRRHSRLFPRAINPANVQKKTAQSAESSRSPCPGYGDLQSWSLG